MKKVITILLSLLLCAVPAVAFASEATDLLMSAQTALSGAPDIAMQMDIGLGIKIGEQEMDLSIAGEYYLKHDPMQLKMVVDLSTLGIEASEIYVLPEGEGYVEYSKNAGAWTKRELTTEEAAEYISDQLGNTTLLLTFGEDIEAAEMLPNEKLGDIDCKVVKLVYSGERLAAIMETQSFSDMLMSGSDATDIAESMGSTDVLYYFNAETDELVRVSIDMTQAYLNMAAAMAAGTAEDDATAEAMSMFDITKLNLGINILAIGDIGDIELPADAQE